MDWTLTFVRADNHYVWLDLHDQDLHLPNLTQYTESVAFKERTPYSGSKISTFTCSRSGATNLKAQALLLASAFIPFSVIEHRAPSE